MFEESKHFMLERKRTFEFFENQTKRGSIFFQPGLKKIKSFI